MTPEEYWQEAAETSLDEMDLFHLVQAMTAEQRAKLGEDLARSHENYGMAFYSPPPSDRISAVEREYKARIAAIEAEAEHYRRMAERAMARVLRQPRDAMISITKDGEVLRHDGRTERIA